MLNFFKSKSSEPVKYEKVSLNNLTAILYVVVLAAEIRVHFETIGLCFGAQFRLLCIYNIVVKVEKQLH